MSYQDYPPPGYGCTYPSPPGYSSAPQPQPQPPPGYPPQYEGYPYHQAPPLPAYPYPPQPPAYQGYFVPPQPQAPYQAYHCEHDDDCFSFLRGCMAALCCCCVWEECCF